MNDVTFRRLERAVDAPVRVRAIDYRRNVTITRREPALIEASVLGTRMYAVQLRVVDRGIVASCTCPYVERELDVCKHIWALVLQLRHVGDPFGDGAEFIDVEPDDDRDTDGEAWDEPPANVVRFRQSSSRASTAPKPPPPSKWRTHLQSIRSSFANEMLERRGEPLATPLLYVIELSSRFDAIRLNVMTRPMKRNGEPGVPKNVTLEQLFATDFEEPEREIIAIVANTLDDRGSRAAELTWMTARHLLPKMAATGRLILEPRAYPSMQPLAWDGDVPSRLHLRLAEDGDRLVIEPALVHGDERIALADIIGVLIGRLAFTRTRILTLAGRKVAAWLETLRRDPVFVPRGEIDEFLANAVALASPSIEWEFPPGIDVAIRSVAPRPGLAISARARYTNRHKADVFFDYEGQRIEWPDRVVTKSDGVHHARDRAAEKALLDEAMAAGLRRDWHQHEIDSSILAGLIRTLVPRGWHIEVEGRVFRSAGSLNLAVSSGIDWFDIEGDVSFGDQKVPLATLVDLMEEGVSAVELPDGTAGLLDPSWRDQLAGFASASVRKKGEPLRLRASQLPLIDLLLSTLPEAKFDEKVEEARAKLRSVRAEPLDPPPGFTGTLRPYQRDALGWFSALREVGFGGCLADDMGLGKTVQVLAMLEARRTEQGDDRRPSLIVVPRSLVFNWMSEAARFTPSLRVLDLSGTDRQEKFARAGEYDVLLTTYALMRSDVATFASIPLDYAILDEAQAIKNYEAETTKAVKLLDSRHRLAMTGTPVENSIGDLASIFSFVNPGMLGGTATRVGTLVRAANARSEEGREARELIGKMVRPFVLRRTKAQVAPELPPRIEKTIYCDLSDKERRTYDELRDQYRASLTGMVGTQGLAKSQMHVLEALLRLRQAACHPRLVKPRSAVAVSTKFEVLLEELRDLAAEGHKALVFSQFTSLLGLLRKELDRLEYPYEYLDGKTKDRQSRVKRFQEDPSVPLFLISLKAGGTGLNLTAAEYVFVLDPWWNPAVEAQAIDRTHRIGQTETVFAYRLVARDTIEEKILLLQATKRELADAIITEDNSMLRQLTEEDLAMLLS